MPRNCKCLDYFELYELKLYMWNVVVFHARLYKFMFLEKSIQVSISKVIFDSLFFFRN